MFTFRVVTVNLIIANVLVFLLSGGMGRALVETFALWPVGNTMPHFQPWQLITYGFLHVNLTHLAFNMLALLMFGGEVEQVFGSRRFLFYYLACVVSAGLAQLAVAIVTASPPYPTIGASGGTFGLLLAFGMLFPRRMLMLLFPPIPMPAWLFVTLYGIVELVLGVTQTQAGVAHFAHLGGMAGGWFLMQYWRGRLPGQQRRR
jgi:membrane associated rhomboid family serine protease